MSRLFRVFSKRGLRDTGDIDDAYSPSSENIHEDPVEDQQWSYNRLKDEAPDPRPSQDTLRDSHYEEKRTPGAYMSNMDLPYSLPPQYTQSYGQIHAAELEVTPSVESHLSSAESPHDTLQSIYGAAPISLFGAQYGVTVSRAEIPDETIPVSRTDDEGHISIFNPYEEMMRIAAPDLQRAITGNAEALWGSTRKNAPNVNPQAASTPLTPPATTAEPPTPQELPAGVPVPQPITPSPSSPSTAAEAPSSCIICIEDFTPTLTPPSYITLACLHTPSVCHPCLARSIKSDLDNKVWNQIRCPECKMHLIYDDIQRLADPETFARYVEISFRNAVGSDDDFVWCQNRNCGFGQLHSTGQSQPIVRCLRCGFRSCFKHSVPWHERLTCDEYDEMLRDPDGFKSALEREEEEERQRLRHEEVLRREREEQEREAEKRRIEEEKRARQREEIRRRKREEEASLAKVEQTTKRCPGCSWPIEKNEGCAHMTCLKCPAQFCWNCLADHREIEKYGNDRHEKSCEFHTDNLPE